MSRILHDKLQATQNPAASIVTELERNMHELRVSAVSRWARGCMATTCQQSLVRRMAIPLLLACWFSAIPRDGQSVEQTSEFLSGLRQRGYFDVAFDYLDALQDSDLITAEQRATLPYERGVTYIAASRIERDPAARSGLLDKAQSALQEFLSNSGNDQSASSARSQLGNILVERARMNLAESEKAEADDAKQRLRDAAREQFETAQKNISQLEEDLREKLKNLPAHINQNQQSKLHAQRTEYRQQYLQTLLLGATIQYEKVSTLAPDSEQREPWLTEAAGKFDEIYQKYRNWLAGRYALLYQARCYQDLERFDDALSMFNELILQEDNSPSYRRLKTKAIQSAIDCWLSPEQEQYVEAILQGSQWFKEMRANEEGTLEWLEFRLALAHAYASGANALSAEDPDNPRIKQHRNVARSHAQAVAKRAGPPLRKQAQELLAQFSGAEEPTIATDNLKTFAEARAAGWEWLQQSQNAGKILSVLGGRLQRVESAEQRADIETQQADAEKSLVHHRRASFQAYRAALQLADESVADEDLNAVRYYLSFLHYQAADYYDAVVMSDMVVTHFAESAVARRCAKISLASYVNLLQQAQRRGDEDLTFETKGLEAIAQKIVKKWPEEVGAQEALVILINIAIQQGHIDVAEQSLQQIPEDSPQRGNAELKTGQALWNKYLVDSRQLKERTGSEEPPGPDELQQAQNDLNELKQRAKQILQGGVERLKASPVSPTLAAASLSLAQIYLDTQEPDQAVLLLEAPDFGSIALAKNSDILTNRPSYSENTYKTALRAYISSLSNASNSADTNRLMEKAEQMMESLEELVGDSPKGRKRLMSIYVGLASDLEKQISLAPAGSREALSQGFETFLLRVVGGADDLRILNWAAEMFYRLGNGNDTGSGLAARNVRQYYQRALTTYDKVLQLDDALDDANLVRHLRMRKASIYRRTGEFGNAMTLFQEILKRRNALITVQVEAAMTLQEWADAEHPDKYLQAMNGVSANQNSRAKIVWGWSTIGRKTSDNPKFSETYYLSRHQLAYCRYRWALSQKDKKRTATLMRAKKDITWTAKFRPDLGGGTWKAKYDALLKKIQQALNEKPVGLAEVETLTASSKKVE